MPDRYQRVVFSIGGGLGPDFGPSFTGAAQNNALAVPFLIRADNVLFDLDGGIHKIGGGTRLNSTQVTESGTAKIFHGIYDAWFQGTGGSETQKRVAYCGTRILKEDVDGTWDELTTGFEDNKEPCFGMFNDLCIIATDSTVDGVRKWNGTDASTSALGGSPPNFSFFTVHKGRVWAAGVASAPSTLYACKVDDPETWTADATATGPFTLTINPQDGDRITGLVSHKNELIVFKGPNYGSIHRITGTNNPSSSASDLAARVPYITGVGAVNHNSIIKVGDDIAFASPRGIHSLAATAAYGDYSEEFLSRPILSIYQDDLNNSELKNCWGVNYQTKGAAVWTFAKSGGTTKNICLVYDYRFRPGRWSTLGRTNAYQNCHSLAILQTSARKHRLFAGTTTGYVVQLDVADRTLPATTAYTAEARTPKCNFGTSAYLKTAAKTYISLAPKGSATFTLAWQRDTQTEQTASISQTQGDTLG